MKSLTAYGLYEKAVTSHCPTSGLAYGWPGSDKQRWLESDL